MYYNPLMSMRKIDSCHRDYNFGLPSFPWVNGRDFAGIVIKTSKGTSRIKAGDIVGF